MSPPVFSNKYYEYIQKKPSYDDNQETKTMNIIIEEVDRFSEEYNDTMLY